MKPREYMFSSITLLQGFSGTQNVSSLQKDEAWRVNVKIQGIDLDHGYLCGTMEALNVPMADTPVVTFWEGEIVDTKNYTFFTGKWGATTEDDIKHWTKFPSFSPLVGKVEEDGGKFLDLSNYPFIFMRWKEQYFVNVGTDCGLTIAGFYYVCFSCSDGSINGFYYDPNSSPFQKLELKSTNDGRSGFSFSSYELQNSQKRASFKIQAAKLPAGVELPKEEPKFNAPFLGFTKTAEIWNSRACMIGLIGTFIVELILNKGILQIIGVDIGKGLDIPL
ncbi:Vacuolar import/degradation protein Vid24 [Abeliophyllum distichum]|uniref:Vacuolar import/degradation protein Vid24 n=1 Tax=Abeliophyllum distichum TaxID=126358 RepID=A0ABD1V8V9_9LAMI